MGFFVDEQKAMTMLKDPRAWEKKCCNCKFYIDPAIPENQKYKNHCMKGFPQTVGGLPIPYYSCGDEFEWKERDDA